MSNVLEEGTEWLAGELQAFASRAVTYRRGGLVSSPIAAIPAQQMYEVIDEDGFATSVQYFDWSIPAVDLVLGNARIEPRQGDRIIDGNVAYDVLPVGKRPCVEPIDPAGILLLLHTRRVNS
jgi:hypothetical protein